MPDREKVIKALECCSSYDSFDKTCMKCPYNIHCQEGDTWAIKQDALAMLKEQQREIEILKAMGLKMPEITVLTDKPIYKVDT